MSLTCLQLSLTVILTQTLLRLQFFQPSGRGDGTERHTDSQFRGVSYLNLSHHYYNSHVLLKVAVMLCSYPPSLPPMGGSTRAAPARWAGGRGERDNCEGDGATSSFRLSFSSFCLPSTGSSPPPVPPPPVLLFIWAWGSTLSTFYLIWMPPLSFK